MPRLIIHAGFHKTGTTSIQKTLRKNRAALRPHARVVLRAGMLPLCEAARGYSVSRSEWDLGLVKYEAAMLAGTFKRDETVLISSEDLCGFIPGRRGLKGYDAAPRLMKSLIFAFREAQPEAEMVLAFTTREAEPWLASCHAQHVRATRMDLSVKDYKRKFRNSAALGDVLAAIEAEVPDVPLHRFALEDHGDGFGPVAPLLALAGVPQEVQAKLTALPPENTAPSAEKLQRLLDINRSDLSDDEVKDAKKALNKGLR